MDLPTLQAKEQDQDCGQRAKKGLHLSYQPLKPPQLQRGYELGQLLPHPQKPYRLDASLGYLTSCFDK